MKIEPVTLTESWRTGFLPPELTVEQITEALGFAPNTEDDESKVEHSWGFTADGVPCGIWDYHGNRWSTFGPQEVFDQLFTEKQPDNYLTESEEECIKWLQNKVKHLNDLVQIVDITNQMWIQDFGNTMNELTTYWRNGFNAIKNK